jgi:hypothetical protein
MSIQQGIRRVLSLASVPLLAGGLLMAQQPGPPPQAPGQPPAQLLSPQQLDTLVAPVALYPDKLLSQILVASTYPLEIAEASQWLQQNQTLQGPQLVEAARQQNWDPSIQAMVVFPDVLNRLASDIRWTTDLGNAFLAQQADTMNAVQRMRAQAQASGKLRSTPQQTVTTEMQGNQSAIDIQPANPEEVYVPYYNPQYIWGPPVGGYYPPWDYADIGFGYGYGFGPGIYIGGFFGGLGWGGWGWGPNWFGCSIFGNPFFFSHFGFGWHGFGAGGIWAHNAAHRLGVGYSTGALNRRYGAASMASARSSYASSRYAAPRASAGRAGGWNRFGQGGTNRASSAYAGGNAYRGNSTYGGANRGASTYRSSPSYAGGGAYRASPSYRGSYGGSYGGGYSRSSGSVYSGGGSVHSGGGSVHSGGGSVHSSGSVRSGGGSHGGGGGHAGGGGGHGGGHR